MKIGRVEIPIEQLRPNNTPSPSEQRASSKARIYVTMAEAVLRLGRITNMEQLNTLTSMMVFGKSAGYLG